MNEMVEASNTLARADSSSLLIIDELGRGTSIYEGLSLAKAILWEIVHEKKALCLFATHFYELTRLEAETELVKNWHLQSEDEEGRLLFSYKVL